MHKKEIFDMASLSLRQGWKKIRIQIKQALLECKESITRAILWMYSRLRVKISTIWYENNAAWSLLCSQKKNLWFIWNFLQITLFLHSDPLLFSILTLVLAVFCKAFRWSSALHYYFKRVTQAGLTLATNDRNAISVSDGHYSF